MNKIPIYIGIDPDTDKSGVAIYNTGTKKLKEVKALSFWDLIDELDSWTIPIHVIIEAGWLIKKSNWHTSQGQTKAVGETIAKNVGANHQVGKLIEKFCIQENIEYTLREPRGKVTDETFKKLTKWTEKTNQDMRDAAMLVYGI